MRPVGLPAEKVFASLTLIVKVENEMPEVKNLLAKPERHHISFFFFQFNPKYPKTIPTLEFTDRKGITEKELAELKELVVNRAKELVGEVMIYELVNVIGKGANSAILSVRQVVMIQGYTRGGHM